MKMVRAATVKDWIAWALIAGGLISLGKVGLDVARAAGDVVRLKTPAGYLEYRVRETFLVDPEDVWVLDSTRAAMLTLITCYPFDFVGNAPRRFIVRAERIDTPQQTL